MGFGHMAAKWFRLWSVLRLFLPFMIGLWLMFGSQNTFYQVSVDCWGVQEQFCLLLIHIVQGFLTNMACASVLTLTSHFQNPNSPPGDVLYVSHDSVPHTVAVATSCYGREKKMIWWQNANRAAESQSWPLNNVGRGENRLVPCEKRKWGCHPREKRPAREVAGCHAALVLITIPFSISLMTC